MFTVSPHSIALKNQIARENLNFQTRVLYRNTFVHLPPSAQHHLMSETFLKHINYLTTLNLSDRPGQYRDNFVYVSYPRDSPLYDGKDYNPPHFALVKDLVEKMFGFVKAEWNSLDPDEASAYLLWRINYIHPFEDGNGRTARALSYSALCLKHGQLFSGRNTVIRQMGADPVRYVQGLRHASQTFEQTGSADLMPLRNMIQTYLDKQLDTTLRI